MRSDKSWLAHISAGLGISALLGVLCFHFPELLTSREFRAAYTEDFARNLLLVGLVAAFVLGTVSILRGRSRGVALLGVGVGRARRAARRRDRALQSRSNPRRTRSAWTGS